MKKALVIGNWKMNPADLVSAKRTFSDIKKSAIENKIPQIIICPPFGYLSELKKLNKSNRIQFGVQNINAEKGGAFTGEQSASMAVSLGAHFVILGHSERRALGETNSDIARKTKTALASGLCPVICIGEQERKEDGSHFAFLESEIKESLAGISKKQITDVVIAYEPIWAIGERAAGAMEPREIHETTLFLRRVVASIYGQNAAHDVRVIYGGSVDDKNARSIMESGGVSGFLVGRASLDPKKFIKIAKAIF